MLEVINWYANYQMKRERNTLLKGSQKSLNHTVSFLLIEPRNQIFKIL